MSDFWSLVDTNTVRPPSVAALTGNGLSIAYNDSLRLDRINAEIQGRITQVIDPGGNTAARTLVAAAQGIHSGDPASDFEALIGALEQYAQSLRTLKPLVGMAGKHDQTMSHALERSSEFMELLRDTGLSHVLEVIAEASTVNHSKFGELQGFIDALLAIGGPLTLGNLNYDSLVMAALATNHGAVFCDMADPREADYFEVVRGGYLIPGRGLRTTANFPARRARLVHLHGSLTWLRRRSDDRVYRFNISDLRDIEYWKHLREGNTDWDPQVVLTNQEFKSNAVLAEPYNLAYSTYESALGSSDLWLIAGYSFRDACVNEVLEKQFQARVLAGTTPTVLVSTYGNDLTDFDIAGHLGVPPWEDLSWLTVHRDGVAKLVTSLEWATWRKDTHTKAA